MTVGDLQACKDPPRAAIDVLAALTGINLTVRRIGTIAGDGRGLGVSGSSI